MFTILGGDGKEYGPVAADKIQSWITGGRANLQTKARRDGETEWKGLGEFPEFAGVAVAPPVAGPTLAAGSVADSLQPAGLEPADRGTRLGAFLIDYLCGLFVVAPGMIILGPTFLSVFAQAARGHQPDFSHIQAGGLLIGCLVLLLGMLGLLIVQVVMLSTRGQTIGKRLLGIRVVLHPDAGQAGFVHGWLLRNFVPGVIKVLPWVGFAFFLVDACFIFRNDRRCIHDFIASTQVVKA